MGTLLLYANNIWLIPLLRSNVPYDPVRDFAPITWAAKSPSTVVVHPALPVKSMEDLIAYAGPAGGSTTVPADRGPRRILQWSSSSP